MKGGHLGCEGRAGLGARRPAQREGVALAEWVELLVGGHPLTWINDSLVDGTSGRRAPSHLD